MLQPVAAHVVRHSVLMPVLIHEAWVYEPYHELALSIRCGRGGGGGNVP